MNGEPVMAPLRGVHRIRKALKDGSLAEYWYAWRGGPSILACSAPTSAALRREVARAAPGAAARLEAHLRPKAQDGLLSGLIHAYLHSPEFAAKAPRTQSDRTRHLAVVKDGLGTMPVVGLAATGARNEILKWRAGFSKTPRTADHYIEALAACLSWARKDRGLIAADPLAQWPRLYSVDRADIIWEPAELAALCAAAGPEVSRAIHVAAYSGLRLSDLLRLTWFQVEEASIYTVTAKRRRGALIPLTPALKEALGPRPAASDGWVLLDPRGHAWKASTLAKHFRAARRAAAAQHLQCATKRWHDFRGTFVTHAARTGFSPAEIAMMVGWKMEDVERIILRYVTREAIAQAAISRFTAQPVSS
jgi:integrase